MVSPGNSSEYQSILLTRYLKEPRLPPSSTYYNTRKKAAKPFSQGKPHSTTEIKDENTPSRDLTRKGPARRKITGGKNEISYRNQNEIMKKIFGNE